VHPVVRTHDELLATAERLIGEFADLPAGSVLRCFSRCARQLRAMGVGPAGLPVAAESRCGATPPLR
jgi:hypothetical protein